MGQFYMTLWNKVLVWEVFVFGIVSRCTLMDGRVRKKLKVVSIYFLCLIVEGRMVWCYTEGTTK